MSMVLSVTLIYILLERVFLVLCMIAIAILFACAKTIECNASIDTTLSKESRTERVLRRLL
ncbi:hypothetical protein BD408DRAFT_412782 [Parasitella parasitica]|nr:hypothetical protein BD408DRAFT_412782 [Parasitella parasitica]